MSAILDCEDVLMLASLHDEDMAFETSLMQDLSAPENENIDLDTDEGFQQFLMGLHDEEWSTESIDFTQPPDSSLPTRQPCTGDAPVVDQCTPALDDFAVGPHADGLVAPHTCPLEACYTNGPNTFTASAAVQHVKKQSAASDSSDGREEASGNVEQRCSDAENDTARCTKHRAHDVPMPPSKRACSTRSEAVSAHVAMQPEALTRNHHSAGTSGPGGSGSGASKNRSCAAEPATSSSTDDHVQVQSQQQGASAEEERIQRVKARNRMYAARTRQKRLTELADLRARCEELERDKAALSKQVHQLLDENSQLRHAASLPCPHCATQRTLPMVAAPSPVTTAAFTAAPSGPKPWSPGSVPATSSVAPRAELGPQTPHPVPAGPAPQPVAPPPVTPAPARQALNMARFTAFAAPPRVSPSSATAPASTASAQAPVQTSPPVQVSLQPSNTGSANGTAAAPGTFTAGKRFALGPCPSNVPTTSAVKFTVAPAPGPVFERQQQPCARAGVPVREGAEHAAGVSALHSAAVPIDEDLAQACAVAVHRDDTELPAGRLDTKAVLQGLATGAILGNKGCSLRGPSASTASRRRGSIMVTAAAVASLFVVLLLCLALVPVPFASFTRSAPSPGYLPLPDGLSTSVLHPSASPTSESASSTLTRHATALISRPSGPPAFAHDGSRARAAERSAYRDELLRSAADSLPAAEFVCNRTACVALKPPAPASPASPSGPSFSRKLALPSGAPEASPLPDPEPARLVSMRLNGSFREHGIDELMLATLQDMLPDAVRLPSDGALSLSGSTLSRKSNDTPPSQPRLLPSCSGPGCGSFDKLAGEHLLAAGLLAPGKCRLVLDSADVSGAAAAFSGDSSSAPVVYAGEDRQPTSADEHDVPLRSAQKLPLLHSGGLDVPSEAGAEHVWNGSTHGDGYPDDGSKPGQSGCNSWVLGQYVVSVMLPKRQESMDGMLTPLQHLYVVLVNPARHFLAYACDLSQQVYI